MMEIKRKFRGGSIEKGRGATGDVGGGDNDLLRRMLPLQAIEIFKRKEEP
jgi:hypothetical protein